MQILASFGVDPKLLVASTINFIVLLFLLQKILYKPLLDILDQRKRTIDESLKNADTIERKLKDTEEKERAIIRQARLDAESLLAKSEQQAALRQKEMLAEAERQSQHMIAQTEAKLRQEAETMKTELQQNVAELIVEATKSILQDKLPTTVTTAYVESMMKSLPNKSTDD